MTVRMLVIIIAFSKQSPESENQYEKQSHSNNYGEEEKSDADKETNKKCMEHSSLDDCDCLPIKDSRNFIYESWL